MTIQSIIEVAESFGIKFKSRVNNRLHFTNGTVIYLEDASASIGYIVSRVT